MHTGNDSTKEALTRAAEMLGGQAALASALGFSNRRAVWPWFGTNRRIPAEHCPAIERATRGAVRCEQLRPDVPWEVLRLQSAGDGTEADSTSPATQPESSHAE